jgi:putative ATP-binding cassette transporter
VLEEGEQLQTQGLQLALPDGRVVIEHTDLQIDPGQQLLISGRSGSGKSTLLRSLAGIWPFASGRVQRPMDSMFIAQRPYFPDGSLRQALAYPQAAATYTDAQLQAALAAAQLPQLATRLGEVAAWNAVLSGGEQQRLAIARVLLKRPAWVFADEATSALDQATEAQVYGQLQQLVRERGGALVSVAHRDSVQAFHSQRWQLDPAQRAVLPGTVSP